MCASQAKTEPRPIADIVREKTNDGAIIVDYLVDVVLGKFEDTTHWHRMEATRQLAKLGVELPQAVSKVTTPSANGRKPSRAPGKPRRNDVIAEIVRRKTSDGEDIVDFLVDVMQGKRDGFKPCHSFSAAVELIRCCYYKTAGYTAGDGDGEPVSTEQLDYETLPVTKQYNDDDDPFDFDHYGHRDFERDRGGKRAKLHIFGGEEAMEVAHIAQSKYWDEKFAGAHTSDYRYTSTKNPGEDPYGRGCYGHSVLRIAFEDNNAIRAANKAVVEYHKQKYGHLLDEDGSIAPLADTESLHPQTLQYLERNRHLLAHDAPQLTEDFKTVPAHELPPTEHPQDPSPSVILSEAEGPPAPGLEHPSTEYLDDPPVGAVSRTAHDPAHPPTEHPQDPSPSVILSETSVILSEAEGPPARDPDRPPGPRRRRKIPRRIHLGPPDEDPPDDNPRRNRHTGDIRIPLKNLHSTSPVPT